MQLINKFHKMESKYFLFELGEEVGLPIWDILRYHVYIKYYYPEKDRERLSKTITHPICDYFKLILKLIQFPFKMLFSKGQNVIITSSRYSNDKGEFFDKSALSIINALKKNCIVIEPVLDKKMLYDYIYDFSDVFRRFYKSKKMSLEYYNRINEILIKCFEVNLMSYEEMNLILHNFYSDYFFYKMFFYTKKTKKLFVATGNPRAILLAAKDLNIITHLIQHASIELDQIDCSYPVGITAKSNILFTHYILTMGDFWCKNINIPVKDIIPIGNDLFYFNPNIACDNSILIISTIVHGGELRLLTKQLAILRKDLKFVYKLHPNEFQYYNDYVDFFKDNKNVFIITNQTDTNVLIAKSQLIIIIVSSVLYEALNQNKKVSIYKKINYQRYLTLANLPNIYFFDYPMEIFEILNKETIISEVNFYEPTNYLLLKDVLENSCLFDFNNPI